MCIWECVSLFVCVCVFSLAYFSLAEFSLAIFSLIIIIFNIINIFGFIFLFLLLGDCRIGISNKFFLTAFRGWGVAKE